IVESAGAVDLDDQSGHACEVARAFLDELHLRKLGDRNGIRDRDVGAGPRIEIERDRQFGFAADRLEIGYQVALRRWTGEWPERRQKLDCGGAPALGVVGEF